MGRSVKAAARPARHKPAWTVYILRCVDDTLYTGIAMDTARRLIEHNTNNRLGARYTRSRRPVTLVYREPAATRAAAARREHAIKALTRAEKERLIKPARRKPRKNSLL
ncbi:MAG: GIY-YIG nuclease family protein [Burkholderiales bacterium]